MSMRAADTDRQAIADILGTAYAEGRLTIDEYQQRLDQTMSSSTYGDLVPIVADLPHGQYGLPLPVQSAGSTPSRSPRPHPTGSGKTITVISVFGQNVRDDDLDMADHGVVTAVFGESRLDLSRANFAVHDVRIDVSAVFGQATIVVPNDAVVSINVVPILGEVRPPDAGQPSVQVSQPLRISLRGVALFGAVHIRRAPAPRPDLPGRRPLSS